MFKLYKENVQKEKVFYLKKGKEVINNLFKILEK